MTFTAFVSKIADGLGPVSARLAAEKDVEEGVRSTGGECADGKKVDVIVLGETDLWVVTSLVTN